MTITEFLLARIAERESAITYAYETGNLAFPILSPAEMLAECEAKRRIVEGAVESQYRWILHELALPYADHPDYRDEWSL